ncbi:MAG: undecaprenyl-phosphate glucose phosphotransferase [Flavobacteriales bacterium]|nr:undecaprenyl-phosphate glucose phosphotransferase [Flavobacteriales bacterium]
MGKRNHFYSQIVLFVIETIILNVVLKRVLFSDVHGIYDPFGYDTSIMFFFNVAWVSSLLINRTYKQTNLEVTQKSIISILKTLGLQMFMTLAFVVFIKNFYFPKALLYQTYMILLGSLILVRVLFRAWIEYVNPNFRGSRNVVVLGGGPTAANLKGFFETQKLVGYQFKGFFSAQKEDPESYVNQLKAFCSQNQIHEIYYAHSNLSQELIRKIVDYADNNLIRFKYALNYQSYLSKNAELEFCNSTPVLTYRKEPLEYLSNQLIKRAFDIVFSLAMCLLVFPWLFLIIGIAVKLSSKGPIFFVQSRSGKDNKEFPCLKFRTMTVNRDSDSKQATKGDARITKVGAFLRKTSLDEMPQFINVLLGHMSVVGPRPHMLKHTEDYGRMINKFMVRHLVKPGITGYAQVAGYRGNTETPELMEARVRHDVKYLENWTIWFDMKLIILTAYNMVKGEENAY